MGKQYTPIPPGRKWFKEMVSAIVFFVMGRAFQSAAKMDANIRREVAEWEEGFRLCMRILPDGPSMGLEKSDGRLRYRGKGDADADLVVQLKNVESAFLVLTPQMGSDEAFAEHRLSLIGEVSRAMSFVRCLNLLIAYLYPKFLSRRLMKRLPEVVNPIGRRIYLYTIGIPFGI